jgi:hypothetical protein
MAAMKLKTLLLLSCLLVSAGSIFAQEAKPAAPPDVATELRNGFTEVSDWVSKAAEMVPAEKYSYRPVDTVRTFGQLVGHTSLHYGNIITYMRMLGMKPPSS